jgi:hypothetical protein
MDLDRVPIVVCGVIFMVVGINAAIYAMASRGGTIRQIELGKRMFQRLRNPWESEDKALEDLSRAVKKLNSGNDYNHPPDTNK